MVQTNIDYLLLVKKRDALEIEVDNAYNYASALQVALNEMNDEIEAYDEEQRVLDE